MILYVTPHRSLAVILLLLTTACAEKQSAPQNPKLTVFFPGDAPLDKIAVTDYLYGPFGAYGTNAQPRPESRSVEIPLSVKGQPATKIKLSAWAPGCRIETFEVSLQGLDIQRTYSCTPLTSVTLVGQVKDKTLLSKRAAEIRVSYLAGWACGFFELSDCQVPEIQLGVVRPDGEGRFEIELPDFAADPIESDPRAGSGFQLVLRDAKTWNPIAFLEPESQLLRTSGRLLRPATHLKPTLFVAWKLN